MKRRIRLWLLCGLTLLVSMIAVLSDLIKYDGDVTAFTVWYWLNLILTNVSAIAIIFLSNSTEKAIQMEKNKRSKKIEKELTSILFSTRNKHTGQSSLTYYIPVLAI